MLRFTKEQMDAFLLYDENVFINFLMSHLQEESPGLVDHIPPELLREMIASGLARARSHGLKSAEGLSSFIALMFNMAPNFDEHPSIRRVLHDESLTADERMSALFERVPDDAWDETERRYDPAAWFPELREPRN